MKKVLLLSIISLCSVFTVKAEFETTINNSDNAGKKSEKFSDLGNAPDFTTAIEFLQKKGVIEGYDNGTYRPHDRINRAELLTLLLRSTGKKFEGQNCFGDVTDQWFAPAICTAKAMEIIEGYSDGNFYPERKINVAEASKIISKILNIEVNEHLDENWYQKNLVALENKKAIPDSVFSAEQEITRGEMAEMIWRITENITEKNSPKYIALSADLPTFDSCAMMEQKIQKSEQNSYSRYSPVSSMIRFGIDGDSVLEQELGFNNSEKKVAQNHSETNVQVAGVDEADIVKTDGKFIYYVQAKTVHLIQAYPAENMRALSKVDLPENFNAREILLHDNQLIILGNNWQDYGYNEPVILESEIMVKSSLAMPLRYHRSKTSVLIYDISDKSHPKKIEHLTFDGDYKTVRRISAQLYLVTTEHIWDYYVKPMDFLPTFRRENSTPKNLLGCGDTRYIPGHSLRQYSSFISIDLDNLEKDPEQEVILGGSSNTVYMSTQNAYIATPFYEQGRFTDWDWNRDQTRTMIFKFSLNDGDIAFEKKGRVRGNLLNQFSMDENHENLRVATTTHGSEMANHLFILDKDMEQVGEIIDIAPGEKIYSTRFIGDRLYMVTFRTIDPLFVIDVKNAKNPRILGKLKIPGYSNYLHPYDENHLIGFGKDTQESKDKSFAWDQGMKLALFDVSDVHNPQQKHQIIIGDRGTNSEVLQNHKALMWDDARKLIGFPINLAKISDEEKSDPEGSSTWGWTEFMGAHIYKVSLGKGFELIANPTHYDDQDLLKMGDYFPQDYAKNIQRILYLDDTFYTISPSKILATDILSGKKINSVKITSD
jgi:inhibitor of cysteine peptidase